MTHGSSSHQHGHYILVEGVEKSDAGSRGTQLSQKLESVTDHGNTESLSIFTLHDASLTRGRATVKGLTIQAKVKARRTPGNTESVNRESRK